MSVDSKSSDATRKSERRKRHRALLESKSTVLLDIRNSRRPEDLALLESTVNTMSRALIWESSSRPNRHPSNGCEYWECLSLAMLIAVLRADSWGLINNAHSLLCCDSTTGNHFPNCCSSPRRAAERVLAEQYHPTKGRLVLPDPLMIQRLPELPFVHRQCTPVPMESVLPSIGCTP